MTNKCDMGDEVKNCDILSDMHFEWPFTYSNVGIYHLASFYLHTDQQLFYTFISMTYDIPNTSTS